MSNMNDVSREMAKIACHALSEKKAEDVQVIDISEISVIADYFVIASAANTNQLQAMMDAAEEDLYKAGFLLEDYLPLSFHFSYNILHKH